MSAMPEPIVRRDFVSAELMAGYRPAWGHPNKRVVYEIACPLGAVHGGNLWYSRWAAMALPEGLDPAHDASLVRVQDGFYDDAPALDPQAGMERHVNFADPHLFVAYGFPRRPPGVTPRTRAAPRTMESSDPSRSPFFRLPVHRSE